MSELNARVPYIRTLSTQPGLVSGNVEWLIAHMAEILSVVSRIRIIRHSSVVK